MSYDAPAENAVFRETESLPFRLLSDPDRSVAAAYGVLRPADHPYPDFPRRVTYVIDPTGSIVTAYEVKDVESHPDEVLAELRRLTDAG